MKPCGHANTAGRCRPCASAYLKLWRERNREKVIADRKKYFGKYREREKKWCEENRGRLNAAKREWYKNNSEWMRPKKRAWDAANEGKRRAYRKRTQPDTNRRVREWVRKNPERHRAIVQKRYAALKGSSADGSVDLYWNTIVSAYRGLCAYCERPFEHMDHVVPLARGGTHTAKNVVPACAGCNLTKNAKTWVTRPWAAALPSEAI